MKLSIRDRVLIPQLFPERGSYEVLKAFKDFMPSLRFSEEEVRKYDIFQGCPTTVECGNCGNEFISLEPANAVDGNHVCPFCKSTKTSIIAIDTSKQQITFNEEVAGSYRKEIKVPIAVRSYIKERLEALSKAGDLTSNFMGLYEVFVLENS